MTQKEAKKLVIDTIKGGQSTKIASYLKRYFAVYNKSEKTGENVDLASKAVEIFSN